MQKFKNIIYMATVLTVAILFFSCRKKKAEKVPDDAYVTTPYNLQYPSYFPAMHIAEDNPLTVEGVELGRRLYYDPLLSKGGPNDGKSCSSCHNQKYGFTILNSIVLPHINLGFNTNFSWKGAVSGTMEDMMKFEVEEFFAATPSNFQQHADYPTLFKRVFGSETITHKELAYALAQFFRTMISSNSRFDKYLRKELQLTPSELNGFMIFNTEKGDCFHCHTVGLFTNNAFHNIGLDSVFTGANVGRTEITGMPTDLGKFKTPTLRNVALRNSFMHDGRFTTLGQVIDHYNFGVKKSNTLDPIMTKAGKEFGLQLTVLEKNDLIAFLNSLTDSTFITNPALSKP